jgi:hypothetical protein
LRLDEYILGIKTFRPVTISNRNYDIDFKPGAMFNSLPMTPNLSVNQEVEH